MITPPPDPAPAPRRVLFVAARHEDAHLGANGHSARPASAEEIRVLVLTDRAGDHVGDRGDRAGATARETPVGTEPAERRSVRTCARARGSLGASTELVRLLEAELAEFAPDVVHVPSPCADDLDQRAASRASLVALAGGPAREVVLYRCDASANGASAALPEQRIASGDALSYLRSIEAENPVRRTLSTGLPATTAVVSTWNKKDDLRANLSGLRSQTLPFAAIVVVDNASGDGTAEMVAREFPEVRLVRMPHDRYGACETFNIGFASATTELVAILDDDIVMPPDWLEKATLRLLREPATTAILSTQVIEPGMPPEYLASRLVNEERYMSTFRGCASLARAKALWEAGFYDERLFIYGNERDLTCRLLNLGYRVLQYPAASVFHKTPFGIKMGKRSLYYHARNAWLSMLKYAPASDLVKMPWLVVSKVLLRGAKKEAEGTVRDAVGTIGIGKSLRETPGAWWVVTRAAFSVLANVPYCWKHRRPCRAPDFELPLH